MLGKSAEPTHEGDRVGETQSLVAAPPQGDLASVGFEKTGIANQTGARDVGVGDRQGSVRNKRLVMTEQFSSMECDAFHVAYLSDTILEAVFHGQAVKTVAYLKVSPAQYAAANF